MYLKISNKGEMNPSALTLMGASTKRGDNDKIGMFGSGNKYAIAYMIRENIGLTIYTGRKQIVIHTEKEKFRDNDFDVIFINNQKTSITTSSGPQWELWKAIREIYSNAIDEGGHLMEPVNEISPKEGETHFYIEMTSEVKTFYKEVHKYFAIKKEIIFECETGSIYQRQSESLCVFRKGIRVTNRTNTSHFEYDLNNVTITEDRVISSSWNMQEQLCLILYQCNEKRVISEILHNLEDGNIENVWHSSIVSRKPDLMSDQWREALLEKKIAPKEVVMFMDKGHLQECKFLPMRLFEDMQKRFGNSIVHPSLIEGGNITKKYKKVNMTALQANMLKQVMDFFKECNYHIDFPIDVVQFKSAKTHGLAENGKILISVLAFERGKNWVANIIIEEQMHLRHQVLDETREFQDTVIGEFITYMQEANSYAL